MKQKNIMVVTTGRADYGLLCPLIAKIEDSEKFNLQLVATGSHLSHLHGHTIDFIEKDGFLVTDTVKMTLEDDSEKSICGAIAEGHRGFSEIIVRHRPDLVVVLGDRYELWPACMAAVIHKVPIAHIHGGEATFGLIDDPIRHSVTKMAAFHFAAHEVYAKRILQMGETPERVLNVGAIGLDNIKSIELMSLTELTAHTGIDFTENTALMTYHPVTLDDYSSAEIQIKEVLNALITTDLTFVVTMPNSDTSGNIIYQAIVAYSEQYPQTFKIIRNMGQRGYLSALKYARLMVGNSSSGIIESASFKLPVVNIGDRQAGRFKPDNVIDCGCEKNAIANAINKATSDEFKRSIANLKSPYGDGNAAERIIDYLESIDFIKKSQFLKKGFYDLNIESM